MHLIKKNYFLKKSFFNFFFEMRWKCTKKLLTYWIIFFEFFYVGIVLIFLLKQKKLNSHSHRKRTIFWTKMVCNIGFQDASPSDFFELDKKIPQCLIRRVGTVPFYKKKSVFLKQKIFCKKKGISFLSHKVLNLFKKWRRDRLISFFLTVHTPPSKFFISYDFFHLIWSVWNEIEIKKKQKKIKSGKPKKQSFINSMFFFFFKFLYFIIIIF